MKKKKWYVSIGTNFSINFSVFTIKSLQNSYREPVNLPNNEDKNKLIILQYLQLISYDLRF